MEALLLRPNHTLDKLALFDNLRVVDAHNFADNRSKLVKERTINADCFSVTDCTAKQAADNIAASLIGRHNAVAYCKGYSPDMVCNNLKRNVMLLIRFVADISHFARTINDRTEQIRVEVGIHILQNGCEALESCARINVFVRKRCIAAVFIVVKLREHQIPYF
ncbi:hypothetical protein D3C78_808590 [compost metagenome]